MLDWLGRTASIPNISLLCSQRMGQKFVVVRKIPNDFRITVSDFDIFSLGLSLDDPNLVLLIPGTKAIV